MNAQELAEQAGWNQGNSYDDCIACSPFDLEKFAKLVAAHTLMNIDPKSFMTWHEGFDAGVAKEREECAKTAENFLVALQRDRISIANAIRQRSKA